MNPDSQAPIQVMLDHGIMTHASRLYTCKEEQTLMMNGKPWKYPLFGLRRHPPDPDPLRERNLVAIYTVCRLIREKRVAAYNYTELFVEALKDAFPGFYRSPFEGCKLQRVKSPVERGKFQQMALGDFVQKGEVINGVADTTTASQLSFIRRLIDSSPEDVDRLISQKDARSLSDFECESLRGLSWMREMRKRTRSDNHLADLFHIWAAYRNKIPIFMTIDGKLIRIIRQIENEKSGFKVGVEVVTPLEFLSSIGIHELDRFVCEYGRFYTLAEFGGMF